jgi:ethanolamine ammonia-lyase large subunit
MTLKTLLAKASPARSGDQLAGLAAGSAEERVMAKMKLADTPLQRFLDEAAIPYETDDVTRRILSGAQGQTLGGLHHEY